MIRVYKSPNAPASLTETKACDGDDVNRQLLDDQHGKCYICERCRDTDFEVEHLASRGNAPELAHEWNNLYMACDYCNKKKSNSFDNILCPSEVNIEDEIEQRLDISNKKALFLSHADDAQHHETVRLLERVFNGTNTMRTVREERFFEQVLSVVNRFNGVLIEYINNQGAETEQAVRDELSMDSELLGFKYWIIRSNPEFYATFSDAMAWNKPVMP